jgi:hypothetical protein
MSPLKLHRQATLPFPDLLGRQTPSPPSLVDNKEQTITRAFTLFWHLAKLIPVSRSQPTRRERTFQPTILPYQGAISDLCTRTRYIHQSCLCASFQKRVTHSLLGGLSCTCFFFSSCDFPPPQTGKTCPPPTPRARIFIPSPRPALLSSARPRIPARRYTMDWDPRATATDGYVCPPCPVFHPTWDEFQHPLKYISRCVSFPLAYKNQVNNDATTRRLWREKKKRPGRRWAK